MSDNQNKIYYDVNIPYRADDKDSKFHNYSKAETEVRMNGPLISDPLNYDLAISKFKIDTECLPIFIPDMQQPQEDTPFDPLEILRQRGELKSKSKVTIYFPRCHQGTRQFKARNAPDGWANVPPGHNVDFSLYDYRWYEAGGRNNGGLYNSRWKHVTFVPNTGFCELQEERFKKQNELPVAMHTVNGAQRTYIQNTNQAFFQYDYQSVLDRINVCMERLLQDVYLDNAYEPYYHLSMDDLVRAIYFKLENGLIYLNVSEKIIQARIMFKFSPDLYKYIGNGFQCRFYNHEFAPVRPMDGNGDGSFFIDYNPFVWRHAGINANDTDERDVVSERRYWPPDRGYIQNEESYIANSSYNYIELSFTHGADEISRKYIVCQQQYSTLANWNVCKAILICSSSFPIKPEFYPTLKRNLYLTHYREDSYIRDMRDVFKENPYDDDTLVFDKSSTKILDVYYPISTSGGDIRSCIIYSNENIENGNKIDMVGGMDLENFDVKVKWVDLYGNVYDLYLAPGCSVNIRLCFTRKKILKDELVLAFNRITESLEAISQHYTPQQDDNKTFDLKKEPKRKRNKVDLPGVLDNGLIIKP